MEIKKKSVLVRFAEAPILEAEKLAVKWDVSVSHIIRQALTKFLKEEKRKVK